MFSAFAMPVFVETLKIVDISMSKDKFPMNLLISYFCLALLNYLYLKCYFEKMNDLDKTNLNFIESHKLAFKDLNYHNYNKLYLSYNLLIFVKKLIVSIIFVMKFKFDINISSLQICSIQVLSLLMLSVILTCKPYYKRKDNYAEILIEVIIYYGCFNRILESDFVPVYETKTKNYNQYVLIGIIVQIIFVLYIFEIVF